MKGPSYKLVGTIRRHMSLVELFHDIGADLLLADRERWTPFMAAVGGEHYDVVKLLLKYRKQQNTPEEAHRIQSCCARQQ